MEWAPLRQPRQSQASFTSYLDLGGYQNSWAHGPDSQDRTVLTDAWNNKTSLETPVNRNSDQVCWSDPTGETKRSRSPAPIRCLPNPGLVIRNGDPERTSWSYPRTHQHPRDPVTDHKGCRKNSSIWNTARRNKVQNLYSVGVDLGARGDRIVSNLIPSTYEQKTDLAHYRTYYSELLPQPMDPATTTPTLSPGVYVTLPNWGNTCFVNSAVQYLVPLYEWLRHHHPNGGWTETPIAILHRTMKEARDNNDSN
eukprot:g21575.t1